MEVGDNIQLMDGGTWIYIVGGIIYLIYNAIQAAKKKKEEAAQQQEAENQARNINLPTQKPKPKPKLADVFEEMMKEFDQSPFPTQLPRESDAKYDQEGEPTHLPKTPSQMPRSMTEFPKNVSNLPEKKSDMSRQGTHIPSHKTQLPQQGSHLPQQHSHMPGKKKKRKPLIESTEIGDTLETTSSYETGDAIKKTELKDGLKSYLIDPTFIFDPRQAIIYSEIMRRPYQ